MTDIAHEVGSDLVIGVTGDLSTSDGSQNVRERVLRRLVTNLGGYIWNLTYGGGLASYVGAPANVASIRTAIRGQMLLEASVARTPVPDVSLLVAPGGVVTMTAPAICSGTACFKSVSTSDICSSLVPGGVSMSR